MKTIATTNLSDEARRRFIAEEGRPLLQCIWRNAVFVHYAVDPDILQKQVPFELELCDGRAFVSLVAFTLSEMRPGFLDCSRLPPFPIHHFLNVRTYVRHEAERGIYFLVEWLTNGLCVRLGPPIFGLPYRLGHLAYEHDRVLAGQLAGRVTAGKSLRYSATESPDSCLEPSPPGSLEEFLIERYVAFTQFGRKRRAFRVWHPAWRQTSITLKVADDSLIAGTGDWFTGARLIGANYSPGLPEVWIGRPHRIT